MTTLEPLYVLDTNVLIWWLTDKARLKINARTVFEAAERGETLLVVPSIVVAEMYFANQKNHRFTNFSKVYVALKAAPFMRFAAFTARQVLNFDRDAGVPEMHDRIIVGLARRLGVPLVTSDSIITASGIVKVVW
jgi:PIN domain nuclease of toxin-antitoxin system